MLRPDVDGETFQLGEDRQVRRVDGVGAEDPAGAHHVQREVALEHGPHLHRRGLGAQHDLRGRRLQVQGVLQLAGGMVGRGVQGVEVEPAVLGFRPLGDLVSHRREDVDHAVDHQRERMAAAERSAGRRHGDVDGFLDENAGVAFGVELGGAALERLVDGRRQRVQALTGLGPLGARQRSERPAGEAQRGTATADVSGADLSQRVEIGRTVDRRYGLVAYRVERRLRKILRLFAGG